MVKSLYGGYIGALNSQGQTHIHPLTCTGESKELVIAASLEECQKVFPWEYGWHSHFGDVRRATQDQIDEVSYWANR